MDIQTFYPVFESGQVLTSGRLNDIIEYLEPQDRSTRAWLTGIGVLCGLQPDWNSQSGVLQLSRGVAVTSAGHLLMQDSTGFNRVRTYQLPVPSGLAASAAEIQQARYPFLFDGNTQRTAWELLPTGFQPAAGEAAPTTLTSAFLADKTVMLFLEISRKSLKQCDMNDCSDKGSEVTLILRRLLVTRTVADSILAQEAVIAGRPVDRARHPRLSLKRLDLEKVNLSGNAIATLDALYSRYLACAAEAMFALQPALQAAFEAYKPLLTSLYPPERFPQGPVAPWHFLNVLAALAENPPLVQYLYAALHDLVASYNEFIDKAAVFDAECAPNTARFPQHVLCGDAIPRALAFGGAPKTLAEFAKYDPLAASGGAVPEGAPALRRHHFIPSPAVADGAGHAAELRSLFSRTLLLAQTFATRDLQGAELQLTPSRTGAAALGERAIPFYYRFQPGGDLHGNWSWPHARRHALGRIPSWQLTASASTHPLLLRQDASDFIRIEGALGKPLGSCMAELIGEKRRLGLAFAVQPVWVSLSEDAKDSVAARQQALAAIQQLLLCRLRDLDVIFLILMGAIFAFLVWLVQLLGRLDATRAIKRSSGSTALAGGLAINSNQGSSNASMTLLDFAPQQVELQLFSDQLLSSARSGGGLPQDSIRIISQSLDSKQPLLTTSVASLYERVSNRSAGGELLERVNAASASMVGVAEREALGKVMYPSLALMARSEELMKVTSVSSISEFDSTAFDTALRGFTDAYLSYSAQAETDPARAGSETASANQQIIARRELVSTSATGLSSKTITQELTRRLQSMFEAMTLPGFAERHPAAEHKGGVPVGGTFVLLYASRSELRQHLDDALEPLHGGIAELFRKLLNTAPPALSAREALRLLLASSKARSEDALDDFVVLGDLCLPYACCDNDCADRVVAQRFGQSTGMVAVKPGRNEAVLASMLASGAAAASSDKIMASQVEVVMAEPAPAPAPATATAATPPPAPATGSTPVPTVTATPAAAPSTAAPATATPAATSTPAPAPMASTAPAATTGTSTPAPAGTQTAGSSGPQILNPGALNVEVANTGIAGTAFGGIASSGSGTLDVSVFTTDGRRMLPLASSTLLITDQVSGKTSEQRLSSATSAVELRAGKYSLIASNGRARSPAVAVAVRAGSRQAVSLQLPG